MKVVVNWAGRVAETFDWPENFTRGEMRLIKRVTGLRPSEMSDAIDADDPDIIGAFVAVAIRRAHPELSDKEIGRDLDALPIDGGIDIEAEDEPEVGQSPPASSGKSAKKKESTNGDGSTSATKETLATSGT